MIIWLCATFFLVCYIILRRRKLGFPFPPGPPGMPLIGNAFDFPTSNIARRFHDFAKRYGPVVYFKILGRSIVVIDSYDVACELLDKRSRNYSDRPDSVILSLTSLSDFNLPLIKYGQRWRHHRRIFRQTLQLTSVNTHFLPNIRQVTHDLLLNLLEKPKVFSRHTSHVLVASILSIGYGIKIPRDDEYYGNMLHHTLKIVEAVVVPGKYVVELFPALQKLPGWFPGAGFKRDANTVREKVLDARRTLYEDGKKCLDPVSDGETMLSMMLRRISALDGDAAADEEVQSTGALIGTYMAGSDTTVASLKAFFLAMAMYPDVQKKAQDELDRVVGRTRLPDFNDRDSLPYINAVVRELTRWNIVAPLALPHAVLEDEEYSGYYIPKGCIVMPNVWAFSRDPDVYPDPEAFNPDRYMKDSQFYPGNLDPYAYIFGFGRRICPGRHLADSTLFLTCAQTLHVFSISPPLDGDERPVQLEANFDVDSVISHPKDFDCVIEPRWAGAADLIKS